MSKVILKYAFIFDPDKLFQRRSDFESYLANMFKAKGCVLERIETPGEESEEIMVFVRLDETVAPQAPQDDKPQMKLKQMSKARDQEGKYRRD